MNFRYLHSLFHHYSRRDVLWSLASCKEKSHSNTTRVPYAQVDDLIGSKRIPMFHIALLNHSVGVAQIPFPQQKLLDQVVEPILTDNDFLVDLC